MKITLNKGEVRNLLNSNEVAEECLSVAKSRAPSGYDAKRIMTGERTGAMIVAESEEAKRDNYQNNTLEKSIR